MAHTNDKHENAKKKKKVFHDKHNKDNYASYIN
jgi:hypothetical protein